MGKYVTVGNTEVHLVFIVMVCMILVLSTALGLVYYTKTIDHHATIVTDGKMQAYSDASCTQLLNSHDWGDFNISSGDSTNTFDFYLKNEGNVLINVTWAASNFTSYNTTEIQFETSKWVLYLVKAEPTEVRMAPENATTPDRISLSSGQVTHLRFYLVALAGSPPEDFNFITRLNSNDS